MKADYQKIEKAVMNYPTKYKEGFINSEIVDLLKKLKVNKNKFNKAAGVNTCMIINNEIISYHRDIIISIVCAIEDRWQTPEEFD